MKLFDHKNFLYIGPYAPADMLPDVKKAHHIYYGQRSRIGAKYSVREFIYWWVKHPKRKTLKEPNVARRDHNKPYSWDNIMLQEKSENMKERNTRCGNPCSTHRAVRVVDIETNQIMGYFNTKKEAAKRFGVSEKTIYNHATGITKKPFMFGPHTGRGFRFQWK